jgi:hypothetical protein
MSVMLLSLRNVLPKSKSLQKWHHDMQDNKTQQNGTQHNNREYESLYSTASIWVSCLYCYAIFCPSLKRLQKWRQNMQDIKTQQHGNQHNNKECETVYVTASIWVSCLYCYAIFCPSLKSF